MNINAQATTAVPGQREVNGVEVTTTEEQMLGKDDFLQILIAQLQNQDPLDPMDDREFIAQMAQFSSLEQMTNMNEGMQRFVESQENGALAQTSELIGKTVEWARLVDNDQGEEIEYRQNDIVSVRRSEDGSIELLLDDDSWIDQGQLARIGLEAGEED
ncbi:flagellar hook assembly protein FlgD [Natribacillus halophilus]|uniref:Flagellar basal-body rod modification protein FlgD n=1 Tax=Natribacillus halophilus TaxID=549003 RepID=A0A1G8PQ01_9BACI|nr:flagellar hook assembly protein FlgD [Natribacillus halophilus]SDI93950.1 flagellar basal-body rod modification protein FlgD [Natribacillus halophilus]